MNDSGLSEILLALYKMFSLRNTNSWVSYRYRRTSGRTVKIAIKEFERGTLSVGKRHSQDP